MGPIFGRMLGRSSSVLFIVLPLILSAYTHLWNPIGFPAVWVVEGQYMQRAMQVLEGQEVFGNIYTRIRDECFKKLTQIIFNIYSLSIIAYDCCVT
jgi:hypothetical protein